MLRMTSLLFSASCAGAASTRPRRSSNSRTHRPGAHSTPSTLSTPPLILSSSRTHAASTRAGLAAATRYVYATNGLPVYVYRLASLAPYKTELFAIPPERRYQRIVALYETMTRFILPLCTHLPHATAPTPVSSVTTIIDLQDVTLSAIWSLRGHLQEASTLATANYPETLNTIAVVNSPSFFPTIWNWVKGCFDEGTQRKVHVLGKDPGPTLRTLIDAKDLPKVYGGELDWKFEHEPALDEHAIKALGEMPKGPVIFEDGELRKPTPPATAEKNGP